jgi:pimeloyl-ACP methyl ester carboxylesterase
MTERVVEVDGIELCVESFGDRAHPPVLLVMGTGASMLWWEEGFCRMLAEGGCFVIRYDHRDTGRSVTYGAERPAYTGADLVADASRVLDAHEITAAHVVGVSAGGALAQLLALHYADRVRSLVLISTSCAVSVERELPPPTEELMRFFADAHVDWSDTDSVIDHQVAYARTLAGGRRPFDEAAARSLVLRDVERAHDFTAVRHHDALPDGELPDVPLSSIAVPTLVIHGSADPMFPIAHGEVLAEQIPGAKMVTLPDAGHGVERADWATITAAILEHTAANGR